MSTVSLIGYAQSSTITTYPATLPVRSRSQDGHESFFTRRIRRSGNGRFGQELRTWSDVDRGGLPSVVGSDAVFGAVDWTIAPRWTRAEHPRRARRVSADAGSP